MDRVAEIRQKFESLKGVMNERMTRLWVAAEALAIGHGGEAIVTEATGIRGKRIWLGKRDLAELRESPPADPPGEQRVRRPGGGRKKLTETDPTLVEHLEELVGPATRGDPESPLRWTSKSTAKLARELRALGHKVGERTVAALLRQRGYSLQAASKTVEGNQHPDRNAQFEHIAARTLEFQAMGRPVISVDTKKKELVGDFKNGGREWQPQGEPIRVRVHDFVDEVLGKAIPYGVYDVTRNEAWVNVGVDHDTGEFAAASIDRWWRTMGKKAYPDAKELFIVGDGGGSNSSRNRLWIVSLQDLANRTGLAIHVSHLPPGTSKWNKIEHRLFSQIALNWRGVPLVSHEAIVSLIAATTNDAGLRVRAKLDTRTYETGVKIHDRVMRALNLVRREFHGE